MVALTVYTRVTKGRAVVLPARPGPWGVAYPAGISERRVSGDPEVVAAKLRSLGYEVRLDPDATHPRTGPFRPSS